MPEPHVTSQAEEQGAWGRPVSERVGELITAAALMVIAVLFMWGAWSLPFGTVSLPGPGFFPLVLGAVLSVLCFAMLYRAARGAGGSRAYLGHRDVLIAFAALVGAAYAFDRTDAYLTLGLFTAILLLLVARASFWKAALGAFLGMIGVYLVLRLALGVRLPTGAFWDVLGRLDVIKAGGQ